MLFFIFLKKYSIFTKTFFLCISDINIDILVLEKLLYRMIKITELLID